jgi:hypothetical protein
MKTQHVVGSIFAITLFIVAAERWYEHPTYGRGVAAMLAAARVALALS